MAFGNSWGVPWVHSILPNANRGNKIVQSCRTASINILEIIRYCGVPLRKIEPMIERNYSLSALYVLT